MRVKVEGKVIPASFRKIEERGDARLSPQRPEREGQLVESIGDQNTSPEAPPRSKIEQKRREQTKCQGRSDCQRSDGEE